MIISMLSFWMDTEAQNWWKLTQSVLYFREKEGIVWVTNKTIHEQLVCKTTKLQVLYFRMIIAALSSSFTFAHGLTMVPLPIPLHCWPLDEKCRVSTLRVLRLFCVIAGVCMYVSACMCRFSWVFVFCMPFECKVHCKIRKFKSSQMSNCRFWLKNHIFKSSLKDRGVRRWYRGAIYAIMCKLKVGLREAQSRKLFSLVCLHEGKIAFRWISIHLLIKKKILLWLSWAHVYALFCNIMFYLRNLHWVISIYTSLWEHAALASSVKKRSGTSQC